MKKLVLALAILCSFSTVSSALSITLYVGKTRSFVGSCEESTGVCITLESNITGVELLQDAVTGELSIEADNSSAIYSELGSSIVIGEDSPIDPALNNSLGYSSTGTVYITAGTYTVSDDGNTKTIKNLDYYYEE